MVMNSDWVESMLSLLGVLCLAILNQSLKAELNDVVLIGAAISATIGVWKLALKPIVKKVDQTVEIVEDVEQLKNDLDSLRRVIQYDHDKQTAGTADKTRATLRDKGEQGPTSKG